MANWYLTVDLSDYWHSEHLGFEEKRDGITSLLSASPWRNLSLHPGRIDQLIAELRKTTSVAAFDAVFGQVYELADTDRVWIETYGKA